MGEDLQAFDVAEVSRLLSVHPTTIRRLVAAGELEGVYVGRQLRVMRKDLVAYLERSKASRRPHDDPPNEESPDPSR